ncbi:hypothetical protein [Specibacter cremeus]|uniref:hypothetical protein n=1 Tax=Specibacter cremeus TaxID=1629051 RepID=UPI000F78EAEF|nr:hypothetical protein [Specibacter cremeus]
MSDHSVVQKFMRFTGRLRVVFGPAVSSPLDHEMTQANRALLDQRVAETAQWETVTRANGSTYLVAKDPQDKSLR